MWLLVSSNFADYANKVFSRKVRIDCVERKNDEWLSDALLAFIKSLDIIYNNLSYFS